MVLEFRMDFSASLKSAVIVLMENIESADPPGNLNLLSLPTND